MERVNPMVREYLSGSLASSFTAGLFNPLEVVKSRLMRLNQKKDKLMSNYA